MALKVLSEADASSDILARFAAERQALAVMDHPSIAKVFDAGTTEDGRPYFVMEVVEGSEFVQFCDERRMGVRDRIVLFAEVCRAVQHAHQKGVIHRDLKPSNVMVSEVDGRPLPRVIDFGIAKAVEAEGFDGAGLTRDDQVIGTPAYMSPQQILQSADVDTRSDVYSLGVLLYELLVGSLPYDPESYRGWTSVAANLHRDPPTLCRRLTQLAGEVESLAGHRGSTPNLLRRELAGDLEWIVSKAMEKEKDHRYETANGLALDLERFLADEPVRARVAGTAYRVRKFLRRNRVGVGVGLAAGIGLVTFAGSMAVQADRIARARDEAEARRDQAEGIIDFMIGDLRDELEPIGRLDILAGVGEQALQYFSSLPQELFSDDELQSRSQALYQVGKVREDQGNFPEARAAYEESLRLAKALVERDPANPDRLFGLSQSHFYVGWAGWLMGDLQTADEEFQAYLNLAERLVEEHPDNLEFRLELGYASSNLGSVREARGDLDGAVESFTRTLEVKEALVRRDPSNISWAGELAEEHNKLAVVFRKQGRYAEALREHGLELEIKKRVLTLAPAHAYWTRRLAWAHQYIGTLELALGDPAAAADRSQAALDVVAPLVEADPSNLAVRRNQATFRIRWAEAVSHLGRHQDARESVSSAIAEVEEQARRDPTRASIRNTLAGFLSEHATILVRAGDPQAALKEAEAAEDLLPGEDTEDRAARFRRSRVFLALGYALEGVGRLPEATGVWEKALSILRELVSGPGGEEFRPALAEAYLVNDRIPEASREIEVLWGQGYQETHLTALSAAKGIKP